MQKRVFYFENQKTENISPTHTQWGTHWKKGIFIPHFVHYKAIWGIKRYKYTHILGHFCPVLYSLFRHLSSFFVPNIAYYPKISYKVSLFRNGGPVVCVLLQKILDSEF